MEKVTAVIKARNEEKQICAAIESARLLAQSVIVVDDSSDDDTAKKAREAGALVVDGKHHGGSIDKLDIQGFQLVDEGWILRMDADERLTPELVHELRSLSRDTNVNGVRYARLNVMFGAAVKHGGWFRPAQLGFFRSDAWDRTWDAELHTQVPIRGPVHTLSSRYAFMVHHDYSEVAEFIERSLRGYALGEAKEMHARGIRFKRRRILWDPFKRVWGRFLVRRGYRDGDRGLILAGMLGAYDICRWSLLWDLERKERDHRDSI